MKNIKKHTKKLQHVLKNIKNNSYNIPIFPLKGTQGLCIPYIPLKGI